MAAVGALVLAPYLLAGPGHFVDDWFALRNAVVDGWWEAAGRDQWLARPGAGVIYALTFGLLGARPLLHAMLAAFVVVATAVLVRRVAARYLPGGAALAVSVAWLIVPNHTSLEAWPSALNIAVSLLLAVAGLDRLTASPLDRRHQLVAGACFAASVLCYEATAPALALAILLLGWRRRHDRAAAVRLASITGIPMVAAGAWMLANWHPSKVGLDVWLDPVQVVNGHVSTGVLGENLAAVLLGGFVTVVSLVALYARWRGGDGGHASWPERAIAGGWLLVLVGAVPFARYFYSPVGLGDRVTVVSGVGGAAVLIGVLGWVALRQPAVGRGLALAVLLGAVAHRASLARDYATAADDSRRILAEVEARWPRPPRETVVFGPHPVVKRNIVAFIDADWPVQWLYRTRDVSAGFTLSEGAFRSVPEPNRIDVVELSDLEPTDRLAGAALRAR